MLKQAFRSYLSALHPRNIKKVNNGNGFSSIYFLFIYPMLMTLTQGDEFLKAFWFMMVKMLPLWLMLWSNADSKFLMPKAMFLCPMKAEDRKEYINYVLLIKIGIPILLSMVIELIWSAFNRFQPLQMIVIAFIHFSIGIAIYICIDELGRNGQNVLLAKREKAGKGKRAWMNVVLLVLGIIFLIALGINHFVSIIVDIVVYSASSVTINVGAILVGIMLITILILDIRILATQYHSTIEGAYNYESAFRVLGKVPTNENVEFDIFK